VSGLTGAGLQLRLNTVETLDIATDGSFTFVVELADNSVYTITVLAEPTGQTCTVAGGSNNDGTGTISGANVADIDVACMDNTSPLVVPPTPGTAKPIPTLSEWALILMSTLLGLIVLANRRRLF
jgi:hypothetical protein